MSGTRQRGKTKRRRAAPSPNLPTATKSDSMGPKMGRPRRPLTTGANRDPPVRLFHFGTIGHQGTLCRTDTHPRVRHPQKKSRRARQSGISATLRRTKNKARLMRIRDEVISANERHSLCAFGKTTGTHPRYQENMNGQTKSSATRPPHSK